MIPVKEEDLNDLVKEHTMLILDLTRQTTDYINNIICRSPTHIASKEGNKTLPAELWLEILSLAELNITKHKYSLVYPVEVSSIQTRGDKPENALVCNIVERWRKFGKLKSGTDREYYEGYLTSPLHIPIPDRYDEPPKNPFKISKTVTPDKAIRIPVSQLDLEMPILYRDFDTVDVISKLEDGNCGICEGDRLMLTTDDDLIYCMTSLERFEYDRCTWMLCPLCIGSGWASECARQTNLREDEDEDEDRMSNDEWNVWKNDRLRELGYLE
ncbi:uncharacterized protein B0J16DRAFT_402694 [Fusarium flagelliforme]|uniref:uncharacterized protein n=1 Tax=Fusarium flagelliforme TaxID=2675880 RepID=UPI001E8D2108|nr:uncharacterized protein B0J16DRAFT_402694 [Fusarium flagelliforme]KAH7179299.1 hypothetical protein B0J16DRAFT_402694 [Fusarium flagelliforme]